MKWIGLLGKVWAPSADGASTAAQNNAAPRKRYILMSPPVDPPSGCLILPLHKAWLPCGRRAWLAGVCVGFPTFLVLRLISRASRMSSALADRLSGRWH